MHSQVVDLAAVRVLTEGSKACVPSNQARVAVWAGFAVSAGQLRIEESYTYSKRYSRQQLTMHTCRS